MSLYMYIYIYYNSRPRIVLYFYILNMKKYPNLQQMNIEFSGNHYKLKLITTYI